MNISAMGKSVTIGFTCAAAAYTLLNAQKSKRKCVKRDASRAIHAVGDMIEGISSMLG